MNVLASSLSMVAVSSKQSLFMPSMRVHRSEKKSKHGVRNFLRRIFRSSSQPPKESKVAHSPSPSHRQVPGKHRSSADSSIIPRPVRLFVLRHGERLDRYYSSQWLRQAFDQDGHYCRFSPILPETLPVRDSIKDFDLDPPLTHKGLKDAYHTGTVLKERNLDIHYCYSSPSLRCIQTAWKILEGLQLPNPLKIRIEPGLFECTGWYANTQARDPHLTMPRFLTEKELLDNKYPIEKTYHEQMSLRELSQFESELEFYQRSHAVTAAILQMHEAELISEDSEDLNRHILFVAHAPSLETCTRQLSGGKFRPHLLGHVIRDVDFLTMTVIEKTHRTCDRWIFRRSSFYGNDF